MTEKLNTSIRDLRKLAPKLNQATDKATAAVDRVEKFLNEELSIGLPVKVFVRYEVIEPLDDGRAQRKNIYLSYDRVDGKFRIAIETRLETQDNVGVAVVDDDSSEHCESIHAWVSCPRAVKLAAFERLPGLLSKLTDRAQEATEQTDATAKTVSEILAALNGK